MLGANKIIDVGTAGLYVGDFADARIIRQEHPDWFILCVLEQGTNIPNSTWIPILTPQPDGQMKASLKQLDATFFVIDSALQRGQNVLLHCGAGIERSPLTAAYYLVKKGICKDYDEAYALIQSKRPQVQNRTMWLS